MNSVMGDRFSKVPAVNIQRSSFNRNCGLKTTMNSGYLVPIFVEEIYPGESHNVKLNIFARLATPIKPVMDNLFFETFFFYVPTRLVWTNFVKMMGEQANPGDSTSYTVPQMVAPSSPVGYIPPVNWATPTTAELASALADYLTLPTRIANISHHSLLHRCYNLIWNEWFRDQNLQNSITVDKGDGPDTYTNYILRRRGKRHDYFTSCLPWPQKGTGVTIPLGTTAPVITNSTDVLIKSASGSTERNALVGSITALASVGYSGATIASSNMRWGANTGLVADLATASPASINSLRQAFMVQSLFEKDARGGTRYTEIVRSHFGVISDDARLQRPEYLGGGSTPVNISPVVQQSQTGLTGGTTPIGNLSGFGVASMQGHAFTRSFTEHGFIIGLANVRADINYQQGMDRMFSRLTRLDFVWPSLAGLGEQAVLNKEIYCDGSANDNLVFGYQGRYDERRYRPSRVTGKFRSNDPTTLHLWHLAQQFGSLPVLNDSFTQDNPPISRVVAVTTEPEFLVDGYIQMNSVIPLPVYGIPGLMERF